MTSSQLESFSNLSSGLNGNRLAAASTVDRCEPYPQSAQIGTLQFRFFGEVPHNPPSKAIFQPSKFRKDCGEGVADHAEPLLDLGAVRP
jgi:hypothetical protein